MANFMCGCSGNRGEVTRLGSKDVTAYVKSWKSQGTLSLSKDENGKDFFMLNISAIGGEKDNFKIVVNNMELGKGDLELLKENADLFRETLNKLKVIRGLK